MAGENQTAQRVVTVLNCRILFYIEIQNAGIKIVCQNIIGYIGKYFLVIGLFMQKEEKY